MSTGLIADVVLKSFVVPGESIDMTSEAVATQYILECLLLNRGRGLDIRRIWGNRLTILLKRWLLSTFLECLWPNRGRGLEVLLACTVFVSGGMD